MSRTIKYLTKEKELTNLIIAVLAPVVVAAPIGMALVSSDALGILGTWIVNPIVSGLFTFGLAFVEQRRLEVIKLGLIALLSTAVGTGCIGGPPGIAFVTVISGPLGVPAIIVAALVGVQISSSMYEIRAYDPLKRCRCGYPWEGNVSGVCPECGATREAAEQEPPQRV